MGTGRVFSLTFLWKSATRNFFPFPWATPPPFGTFLASGWAYETGTSPGGYKSINRESILRKASDLIAPPPVSLLRKSWLRGPVPGRRAGVRGLGCGLQARPLFATGAGGRVAFFGITLDFYRLALKGLAALRRVHLWGFPGILELLRHFFPINFFFFGYTLERTPGFQQLIGRGSGGRKRAWEKRRILLLIKPPMDPGFLVYF